MAGQKNIKMPVDSNRLKERDIFLLDLVREKYKKISGERHFIEWKNGVEVVGIRLNISERSLLVRFYLTENEIPLKEIGGRFGEINLSIGRLDSHEKFRIVENEFYKIISNHIRGIENEINIISVAEIFAIENNYELIQSEVLDNSGVDFVLKHKFFGEEFYFQIKSSWFYVREAKERGKGFYNKKEIIFLVASKNKNNSDFYRIIESEIRNQKNII